MKQQLLVFSKVLTFTLSRNSKYKYCRKSVFDTEIIIIIIVGKFEMETTGVITSVICSLGLIRLC